jgi:hypothetical protein
LSKRHDDLPHLHFERFGPDVEVFVILGIDSVWSTEEFGEIEGYPDVDVMYRCCVFAGRPEMQL